jgi:hypothetical protein
MIDTRDQCTFDQRSGISTFYKGSQQIKDIENFRMPKVDCQKRKEPKNFSGAGLWL